MKKKKEFNEKMSLKKRFPRHLNLAKGGAVVQKFADGGAANPTVAAPGNLSGPSTGGVNTTAATGAGQTGLVGTISNALGVQNQFQGQAANLTPGTNAGQLNTAYNGVQNALGQQTNIANQLTPQVGSAVNNQNTLANQYLAMSQGQGPNPAQAQLNQDTGANVAAQAALMAGQRGASSNVGQIARGAAQQGATTQQQAVGQGATLEAQQQIAAQQNLANLSNNQINQAGNATGAAGSAQQNEQNILQNANTSLNNAAVGMQSNLNNVNSQTAASNQNMNANVVGGIGNMLSNVPVVGSLFARGGRVQNFDDGGSIDTPIATDPLVGGNSIQSDNFVAPQSSAAAPSGAPGGGGAAALPATSDALSKVGSSGSSGGGGGGSGLGSLLSLAALMANGGEVQQTGWVAPQYNASSASSGPSIQGTSPLPATSKALSTLGKNHKKPDQSPSPASNPTDDGTQATDNAVDDYTPGGAGGGATEDVLSPDFSMSSPAASFARGGNICRGPYKSHVANFLASGGKTGTVPALVSPKEVYLSPKQVHKVIHEGADPMKIGYHFPGNDKVKGRDSRKNDVIPTTLESGGNVIPVHITTHKDASNKARAFVKRTMAKHMKRPRGA